MKKHSSGTDANCTSCASGFNYCFWAKLLVAIPAIPMVVILAAAPFTQLFAQLIAGGLAAFVLVAGAVIIDRMPLFSGKVVKR